MQKRLREISHLCYIPYKQPNVVLDKLQKTVAFCFFLTNTYLIKKINIQGVCILVLSNSLFIAIRKL